MQIIPALKESELCDYDAINPAITDSYEQEPIGTIIYSIPVEGEVGTEIELSLSVEDGHDDKFDLDIQNITWAVVYDMEAENTLTVIVGIADVNEFPPVLEDSPYKVNISEFTQLGTTVLIFGATDEDCGIVHLYYEINKGPGYNLFDIPSVGTPEVILVEEVDYEENTWFNITLLARDSDDDDALTGTGEMHVSVIDGDDMRPIFGDITYNTMVTENDANVLLLPEFPVNAYDQDFGIDEDLNYSFADPERTDDAIYETEYFRINDMTGEVTLIKELDREALPGGTITEVLRAAQVNSMGYHVYTYRDGYATLVVTVLDVNDNIPNMSKPLYYGEVAEHSLQDTIVCEVSATDIDEGENAIFNFVLQSDFVNHNMFYIGDPISITPNTAVAFIRVNDSTSLDAEYIAKPINFTVYAIETQTSELFRSEPSTVSITVSDINDNIPLFVGEPYIASVNGDITEETYLITVYMSDLSKVYVNITDIIHATNYTNNASEIPVFLNDPYNAITSEGSDAGASIYRAMAVDVDGDDLTFTFGNGFVVTNDGIFRISPNTGEIFLNRKLDRENVEKHSLMLLVHDGNPDSNDTTVLSVVVTDINDNDPVVTALEYNVMVPEEEAGFVVTYVRATDVDYGINADCTFTVVDRLVNDFAVHNITGKVTTRRGLDREHKETYEVYIVATDHGRSPRSGETYVTVTLTDVNDNPPEFELNTYRATVVEYMPEIFILSVKANDMDAMDNAAVRYAIIPDSHTDYNLFTVDAMTGNVYFSSYESTENVGENLVVMIEAYNEVQYTSDDILNGTTTVNVTILVIQCHLTIMI
ncbi:protocadherin-15-like [Saccoglossus kowalevskii]